MNISRIAEERKKLGLNQEELAKKLQISQKSISKYERGDRRPSYEVLVAMSSIFGVSVDYLLGNDSPNDATSTAQNLSGGFDNSIRYWIEKTGYGFDEVAKKLGISSDVLADYMNDTLAIPYTILISLSEICEVSTDCLLGMITRSRERDLDNVLPFQYNYEIAGRIRKLCEESVGTSSSFLESLLTLSSKEVYYMIEYGFIPHVDTIIKLSDYFNVSIDYILCRSDIRADKLLSTYKQLNDDNKDIILGDAKKALREQRYEESVAAGSGKYLDDEKKSYPSSGTGGVGA